MVHQNFQTLAKFKRVLACSCYSNFCVARKKIAVLGMLTNAHKDHLSPLAGFRLRSFSYYAYVNLHAQLSRLTRDCVNFVCRIYMVAQKAQTQTKKKPQIKKRNPNKKAKRNKREKRK